MIGSFIPFFGFLVYVALIGLVVWSVVSALNRISRGVEDIAQTLRHMESKGAPNQTTAG